MTHCGSCLCVKQNVVCGCTLRRNVWTCVNDSLWQLSLRQTECCMRMYAKEKCEDVCE